MEFGVALPHIWTDYGSIGLSATLKETARQANDLGYGSLWVGDIVIEPPGLNIPITEPLVTLASLINEAPSLQFGTSILVLPQRNAIVVAKQAADLANLSDGRFILGVAAGKREDEFRYLNADFASRGRKMDESIDVMRLLWREDNAEFKGQFYNFEDGTLNPRPNGGHVPLWIGGTSPVAIRRAARSGEAWLSEFLTPEALKDGVQRLRSLSKKGQSPLISSILTVHVVAPGHQENEPSSANIAGTPEKIISTLQAYEQAGLEHLICFFRAKNLKDLSCQMQTFSQDVMPHFAFVIPTMSD